MRGALWLVLLAVVVVTSCSEDSTPSQKTAAAGDPERGRRVYLAQCAACHHRDPSRDGPIGPAVRGSPQPLVEARVLHANYPPGYKPKRNTTVMPAQPYLKPAIADLAAFLR